MTLADQLCHAVAALARVQGRAIDTLQLDAARRALAAEPQSEADLRTLCEQLQLGAVVALAEPDAARLPVIGFGGDIGWGIVTERTAEGRWVLEQDGTRTELAGDALRCARVVASASAAAGQGVRFEQVMKAALARFRGVFGEAALATMFINMLALAASLFSMQVYDRVIPTRSESTLVILASGVLLVIVLEVAMKLARAKIMDAAVIGVDSRLSRAIFERLLAVRIDRLPGSVGTLAGQLRGYEQVRSFYTASTLFALVDLPMAMLFIVLIAVIGSPWLALVPLVCAVLAVSLGIAMRRRLARLAGEGAQAANRKTGLLVEAVEGIETIKSGAGGWKFLSRWLDVTAQTLHNDLRMRHSSDTLSYFGGALQQLSYAAIVAVGAWVVMQGGLTMGGLIACSILGGRVLAPVAALPGLLVQQSHARAALQGLEALFGLETDNHGVERPLAPANLTGHFKLDQAEFAYAAGVPALKVAQIEIRPGERVGVLGPIGSGKSTLLRLLSGLYRPQAGRVLIDGLDLAQVSRQSLSQQIGYLQQEHRLFQGTLRENLLIGLPDPGDDAMQRALQRSGLAALVARHPRGLELPISEGGRGLSGGQRQLVAFTRLLLSAPRVLLLDEPTASMDDAQERQCLAVLKEELERRCTFVVVTHKPSLLPLVDRLIVIADQQVLMDGPRDQVLARLQPRPAQPTVAPLRAVEPAPPAKPGAVRVSSYRISGAGS